MSNRDRNNSRESSKNALKGGSSESKDNPKDKPQGRGSAHTSPQITSSADEDWADVIQSAVYEERSDIGMCSTMLGIPAMDIPSDPNLSNEVGSSEITAITPQTGRLNTQRQLPVPQAEISKLQPESQRQTIEPVDFKNTGRTQSAMFKGIKMSAPSLSIHSDEISSISGVPSSNILPSVDIDKSFDMPIVEMANLIGSESKSSSKSDISSTRHKIDVMSVKPSDSAGFIESEPTSIIDMANLPDSTKRHEDTATIRRLQKTFIQSQLFDDRRFRMLGRLINFRSLDCARDVDALMNYLSSTYQNERPVVVQLRSNCDFGRESVLRAFLQRCNKELELFRTYAEIYAADGSSCDLVTSLVASRIALFPHEEESHKITRILSAAEEALNLEDQRWGVDILFIRYGLRQYVANNKNGMDISALVNRNESDMLELLESMIIHDAAQGPVVLIFSIGDTEKQTVWRDLVLRLKKLPISNVLIILNGGTSLLDQEPLEHASHEVAPLTERDSMLIINQLLPYLSQEDLNHLSDKCGGNLTQLRRVMRIFQRQNPLENPNPLYEASLLKFIDSLPDNPTALSHTYYNSFTTDECRFLNVASILGGRFYLNDLTTLLSLEPLPNEIPGFKDLRSDWCEHIASQLMESGEIFMIHQDEKRGIRFEFPEYKLFENLSTRMDKVSAQRLHGSFGRILERGGAPETRIATQYEAANMWPEAATHWLSVARRYNRNFYDQTSYAILKTCLQHIGPQYEDIYPALLRECMTLSCHIGRYNDVCYYADQLTRIGKMLSDTRCMAKAFIDMSNALRIQGNYQRAKEMAQYGLELSEKLRDDVLISLSNHTLAQIIFDSGAKGSLVNALRYAEKALETRRHLGDLTAISHTQTLCSRIYLRRGEPARAKTAAIEAYHALMACGHWYETPIVLTSLARSTSALQEAMLDDYLDRGFAIVEKTGDVEHQFELLTAHLLLTVNTLQRQAVRADLDAMRQLIKTCQVTPWTAIYHLLTAMFDFSRKNFQKTTKALRCFFDSAQKLDNSYIMALGYSLSAELNFEVYKRNLSTVSLEKTEKLYISATSLFESVGAWHEVARTLRLYASFLDAMDRREDAQNSLKRADKVDPYRQM